MNKSDFRKSIEKIKGDRNIACFYVKDLINQFFNERKIWYNKIEKHNGNLTNSVSSDIDYIRNIIGAKFGTNLGIDFEKIKLGVIRSVYNSKQRISIKKAGKYRKRL